MTHNRKILISESEKTRILSLYENSVELDCVILDWLSPDEKYVIFLDELYDIKSKTKLGNIWENFDNFKFFLKHSFEVSTTVSQQIKEDVLKTLDSFLITESTQDLSPLKPIFKKLLKEDWGLLGDLGNWVKDTTVGAVKGISDFASKSWEGVKKMGLAISQGDWSRVLDLFKKGTLYVARKIREAMYHPIGLILDAILVASQIGKGLAWIPWAIVVALDVYEFISGNYEDPDLHWGWRLLFFAVDMVGLVLAGAAAKGPKTLVLSLINKFGKGFDGLQLAVKNTPALKSFLNTVGKNLSKVEGLMKEAQTYLKTKSPTFYKFFSGIMGGIGKLILKITNLITNLLSGATKIGLKILNAPGKLTTSLGAGTKTAAAANMLVPAAVIGTYQQNKKEKYEEDFYSALKNSEIESDYDINQLK